MNRFRPLDVFRGMTICFMIIVNTPGDWGSTYSMLLHAPWHGFTPTDLVFPSFLFAVGNAMAFVSLKWEKMTTKAVFLKGLKRGALIFLIGFLLYWFPFVELADETWSFKSVETTRVFGVLQRIGLCYILALPFIYYVSTQRLIYAGLAILLAYWGILVFWGDLSLEANVIRSLDLWLIGPKHMYHGEGIAFDPEGLLSTLPATVNVFGGYLAGVYLRKQSINYEHLAKLLLAGMALTLIGWLWDFTFPLNKKIWTSSFTVFTIGLDLLILGGLIYIMEFSSKSIQFNFFNTFGKNPLFIYLLSSVLAVAFYTIKIGDKSLYSLIYQHAFAWIGGKLGSLIFALAFTMICWAVGRWLEIRKIYIKI